MELGFLECKLLPTTPGGHEAPCHTVPPDPEAEEPPIVELYNECGAHDNPSSLNCAAAECQLRITCPDGSYEYFPSIGAGMSCKTPEQEPQPSGTPTPTPTP